jgi:hypothetical protein
MRRDRQRKRDKQRDWQRETDGRTIRKEKEGKVQKVRNL